MKTSVYWFDLALLSSILVLIVEFYSVTAMFAALSRNASLSLVHCDVGQKVGMKININKKGRVRALPKNEKGK